MTIDLNASRLLDPGERLIWSGKPMPLRYALKKSTVTSVFGLFFFGFSVFWVYGVANQAGTLFAPFVLFGIPFMAIGLGLVLSPFWHFYQGSNAIYALTDRRAVIDISGVFQRRTSVPLAQVRFVEVRRVVDGVGDVLFREIATPSGEGTSIRRDGFLAIANVDRVERLLRTSIGKSSDASGMLA